MTPTVHEVKADARAALRPILALAVKLMDATDDCDPDVEVGEDDADTLLSHLVDAWRGIVFVADPVDLEETDLIRLALRVWAGELSVEDALIERSKP